LTDRIQIPGFAVGQRLLKQHSSCVRLMNDMAHSATSQVWEIMEIRS
jgi:hypothetical protein